MGIFFASSLSCCRIRFLCRLPAFHLEVISVQSLGEGRISRACELVDQTFCAHKIQTWDGPSCSESLKISKSREIGFNSVLGEPEQII